MGGSPRQTLEPDTPRASFPAARPSQPGADPGRLRVLWAQPAVRTLAAAWSGLPGAGRGQGDDGEGPRGADASQISPTWVTSDPQGTRACGPMGRVRRNRRGSHVLRSPRLTSTQLEDLHQAVLRLWLGQTKEECGV